MSRILAIPELGRKITGYIESQDIYNLATTCKSLIGMVSDIWKITVTWKSRNYVDMIICRLQNKLFQNLKEIHIYVINGHALITLIDAICQPDGPKLTCLSISNSILACEEMKWLDVALSRHGVSSKLKTLVLHNNWIGESEEIPILSGLLSKPDVLVNLEKLDLSMNHIDDEGIQSVTRALSQSSVCPKLSYIDLSWNKIDSDGMMTLIQLVPVRPRLVSIDLRDNYIMCDSNEHRNIWAITESYLIEKGIHIQI